MMTMHILSAGDGYAYYTSETATGDAVRDSDRELGDYYTADGNPPGAWVGSGLDALGVSGTVSEDQMKALFGEGLHPDAERIIAEAQDAGMNAKQAQLEARLGRGYYAYNQGTTGLRGAIDEGYARFLRTEHREPNADERRAIRVREGARAFRDAKGRQPADKEELGRFITAASRPTQQAVAGFDLVFPPAKSVSTLWGLGDNDTRQVIERAHEAAIDDTVRYLETEAIATRAGRNGVAQIEVEGGLIATRFRHYDSRTGDPQLHDHLVVANKAKGSDGKWRTIDSKLLHRQGVAASEFYNSRVMDRVTDALGLTTELREVTPGKRPVVEIAGIDDRLTTRFSSRSADIKKTMKTLEKDYRRDHGRAPDMKARVRLAQQATLDTRPVKAHARSLSELRAGWQAQASAAVGGRVVRDVLKVAQAAARRQDSPAATPSVTLAKASAAVVETVSEHHAVWGPHTIEAEARRYIQTQRAAGVTVDANVEEITDHALTTDSVTVTPPAPHGAFQPLTRGDGSSIYEHKGRQLLTSRSVLVAEDTLLDAARDRTVRPVSRETFERIAAEENATSTHPLDPGQHALAGEFATSSTRLVVGTGPAGAGKTTALRVAARAVEAEGGKLVGLAPSATAAAVMADALDVDTRTIHSFTRGTGTLAELLAHDGPVEGIDLSPGDVIVVDEAGMAGTMNLAKVTRIAERHGAHVRLIGDDRQLAAVEAGGALRLLEHEVGSVKLDQLHRFTDRAEADATKLLRDPAQTGDPFAWYVDNRRVRGGDVDRMTGDVFAAWQADTEAGKHSVMLAQTNTTVTELNTRAQALRMSQGAVTGRVSADVRGDLSAFTGDVVVTRVNRSDMKVSGGRDRVKNGDQWTVREAHEDGSLSVEHNGHGGRITLPADYVRSSTELGYASTIHRAQGMTADTAHVLADAATSRELAYVGLTRGREANHLYVETEAAQPVSDVLEQIAGNAHGMLSATETIRAEQARVDDLVSLIDQYGDVAERADTIRFRGIAIDVLGEDAAANLLAHDSWGAVEGVLRGEEKIGHDPAVVLGRSWYQRNMLGADDVGAVLAARITNGSESFDQVPRLREVVDQTLGVDLARTLRNYDTWPAVENALRRAEKRGHDPAEALATSWDERDMVGAHDVPAVLAARINKNTAEQISPASSEHDVDVPAAATEPVVDALPVPTWIADRTAIDSPHTPPEWREHMAERYDYLRARLEERGATIAAEQPEWTKQLGEVPAEPARREEWTQLAAEIDVFRQQYHVDVAEPVAIPDQYRERAVGADLAQRVTALHKSTQLSTGATVPAADRQCVAQAAGTTAQKARDAVTTQQAQTEKKRPQTATEVLQAQQRARAAKMQEQLRRSGVKVTPTRDGDRTAIDRQNEQGRDQGGRER